MSREEEKQKLLRLLKNIEESESENFERDVREIFSQLKVMIKNDTF